MRESRRLITFLVCLSSTLLLIASPAFSAANETDCSKLKAYVEGLTDVTFNKPVTNVTATQGARPQAGAGSMHRSTWAGRGVMHSCTCFGGVRRHPPHFGEGGPPVSPPKSVPQCHSSAQAGVAAGFRAGRGPRLGRTLALLGRAGMPNNIPVALMSSSMSGQCTPNPLPMNSKLLRWAGVASDKRHDQAKGTLMTRPSARCATGETRRRGDTEKGRVARTRCAILPAGWRPWIGLPGWPMIGRTR